LGLHPDELAHNVPVLQENQGWNAADIKPRRQSRCIVNIHFGNGGLGSKAAGEVLKNGSLHVAGAAPGRPKVHKDNSFLNRQIEGACVQFHNGGIHHVAIHKHE